MSPYLPEPQPSRGTDITPLLAARIVRENRKAELEVYRYKLDAAVTREKDIIDTETLEDVITEATEAELRFLNAFRAKANDSETAREIVARKLEIFDAISNRRIARRFRG
jgi:hypothetical protein